MIVKPMPDMEVIAIGSSHYKGDIYKDLTSNWVQKVNFDEIVVAEATISVPPNKANTVVERSVVIANVSEEEFLKF
jgi:Ni,Fe-hydrogenase III small subunit